MTITFAQYCIEMLTLMDDDKFLIFFNSLIYIFIYTIAKNVRVFFNLEQISFRLGACFFCKALDYRGWFFSVFQYEVFKLQIIFTKIHILKFTYTYIY